METDPARDDADTQTGLSVSDIVGTLSLDSPLSVEDLEALRKGAAAVVVTIDQALDEQRFAASR